MRHHHEDMFNGAELGARFAHYHQMLVDGGGGGGTTTNVPASGTNEQDKAAADKAAADKKKAEAEKPKPTPVEQAKEAIKDGKISPAEKKVTDTGPVREAIKGQKETLREKVAKAEGAPEHWRDQDGKLELYEGKAAPTVGAQWADTEHEERVEKLTENKDKQSLDSLDDQIKQLKDAGVTTGLKPLEEQRAARAAEEKQVAAVVEDKENLLGVLEAEKDELEAKGPAEDPYKKLNEDAAKWLAQFNANGGQSHTGDWFGDSWDNEDGDISLDQLMGDLDDEGRMKDFLKVQGHDDGDGGDSPEDMEKHIADVIKDDPEEGRQIALRYQAATELKKVYGEYFEARDAQDGNKGEIEQIDAEIGILKESIEADRASLSTETLEAIDKANVADTEVIPAENSSGSPDERDETGGTDNGDTDTGGTDEGGTDTGDTGGTDNGDTDTGGTDDGGTDNGGTGSNGGTDNGGTDNGGTGDDGGTEGTGENGGVGGTNEPTTKEVAIDYSTPERSAEVLKQAQERSLVPAENTSFDDKGQAVYKVQPNDSYWRIADMSDGKPPHQFDYGHFETTVKSNSERFGRPASSGLIHPNEDVVIPGRSIEELVALMGLPTTETVEVEPEREPYPHGRGRNVPY